VLAILGLVVTGQRVLLGGLGHVGRLVRRVLRGRLRDARALFAATAATVSRPRTSDR
jgi:hypothetical protein